MRRSGFRAVCVLLLWFVGSWGCALSPVSYMAGIDAAMAREAAEAAARPIQAQAVEQPKLDPEQAQRLVVYNAVVHVVVERITDSLNQIKAAIEGLGGYMQEMSANSITVKVPANKFHDAIAAIEKLGEVAQKEIKGTDVTDMVRDLAIRLQNAEQLRQRLLKLLEKSDKVEDTLKVEKELGRITETIELIKGKLRFVENKIAFSTITVHLNSPVPQRQLKVEIPFGWVRELGSDLTRGSTGEEPDIRTILGRIRISLPDAYIKYFQSWSETRAMSADGVLVALRRHDNYKGGNLDFWAKLVRRILVEQRAIALKDEVDVTLRTGVPARMLCGSKEIGGKPYGYLVAIVARKSKVYAFEAWGPLDKLTEDRPKIEKAIQSLRVGPWHRLLLTLF